MYSTILMVSGLVVISPTLRTRRRCGRFRDLPPLRIAAIVLLALMAISCKSDIVLKNTTRPGGYAMGERVSLKFSTTAASGLPDSIPVVVIEKKSGYRYELSAAKAACDSICAYLAIWDGRKPDGSWPMGGRYSVFSVLDYGKGVYSDTVEIGLGD